MAEAQRFRSVAVKSPVAGDFTAFVVCLRDAGDQAVDAERFGLLWSALRRALRSELMGRGLWHRPPSFLGVVGFTRWSEAESNDDALDELTADCYTFVFLERIQSLVAQLRMKPAIEGLVFRSIRNFLYERQKRYDPIGFRVFTMLREAVQLLASRDVVTLEPAGSPLGNQTWIFFQLASLGYPPGPRDDLQATVTLWSDRLLPALMVARGQKRLATVELLAELIAELAQQDISRLRLRRLAEPLKLAVRSRWTALLASPADLGGAGAPELVRLIAGVRPPDDMEQQESFARLIARVEERVVELDASGHGPDYLLRLWRFARAIATDSTTWPATRRYSRAAVAEELSIPRNRMPELCAQLEGLIQQCRGLP